MPSSFRKNFFGHFFTNDQTSMNDEIPTDWSEEKKMSETSFYSIYYSMYW